MNFTVTEHHMKSYIEVAWTHIYPVHERNFETGFIATPFRNFLHSCTNTGWCKRNVTCLNIPAPTAATQWRLQWTAQSANFGKF